jgi:hypothetical protein
MKTSSPYPVARSTPFRCPRGVRLLAIAIACAAVLVSLCLSSLAQAGGGAGTLGWSTPALPGTLSGEAESVSCSSVHLCVLTSSGSGYLVYNGTTWSAPGTIPGAPDGVSSLDCVSGISLCTAVVDREPHPNVREPGPSYVQFNGKGWSKPITPKAKGKKINGVSCTSKAFCVGLFDSSTARKRETSYAVDKDGRWSVPKPFYNNFADLIDCVSTSFCEASDANAIHLLTFNGKSWKTVTDSQFTGFPAALSCPTSSFCVLGQGVPYASTGSVLVYNGTKWTGPDLAGDKPSGLVSVSCASASFCVAGSSGELGESPPPEASPSTGSVYYYSEGEWSAPTALDSEGIRDLSCPSRSFCLALDGAGRVLIGR